MSLFAAPARWGWRPAPPSMPVAPLSGRRPPWVEPPPLDTTQLRHAVSQAKSRVTRRIVFGIIFTIFTAGIASPIVLILIVKARRARRFALDNLHNTTTPTASATATPSPSPHNPSLQADYTLSLDPWTGSVCDG